jgi:membrane-bound lytic murein transglycosylase A
LAQTRTVSEKTKIFAVTEVQLYMPLPRKILLLDLLFLVCCLTALWVGNSKSAAAAITIPYAPGVEANDVDLANRKRRVTEKPEKPSAAELDVANDKRRRLVTSSVLIPARPDTMPFLAFDPQMLQALYEQTKYLYRKDVSKVGASGITKGDMLETVERLQETHLMDPRILFEMFDFYRINTDLHSDRIRLTGYYTPLIKAARQRDAAHPYPLLRRPDRVPSPAAIEAGALEGQGLELAWLSSKKEVANAQLQGSCLVEFPDGERQYYGFGGSVRGEGGCYVFFTKVDDTVLGSGTFPLTAGYSVAVDPRFIPIGATVLAELPDLDPTGKLKGYKYRIIFAQDRGGAIKTTKRMDLYCGVGQQGLQEARKINGFARMWVMLPK